MALNLFLEGKEGELLSTYLQTLDADLVSMVLQYPRDGIMVLSENESENEEENESETSYFPVLERVDGRVVVGGDDDLMDLTGSFAGKQADDDDGDDQPTVDPTRHGGSTLEEYLQGEAEQQFLSSAWLGGDGGRRVRVHI